MEKGHAVYSTQTKILRGLIWVFMLFMAVLMIFPVLYIVFDPSRATLSFWWGNQHPAEKVGVFKLFKRVEAGKFCQIHDQQYLPGTGGYDRVPAQLYHGGVCIFQEEI